MFENEDSRQFALDLSKKESAAAKKDKSASRTIIFPGTINQPLRLLEASEPTDIIWENRAFTDFDHKKREAIAYIVILILLYGVFYLTYLIAFQSAQVMKVFPPQDCLAVLNTYGEHIAEGAVADFDWVAKNDF